MADNDIARRGYMHVVRNPKDGVMGGLNRVTSKRYWVVLIKNSRGGQGSRLELYKSEDQRGEPQRTINLDSLRNIETAEKKKAFVLHLPEEVCMFQCASRAELDDWHRDILTYRGGGSLAGGRASLSGLPNSPAGGEIYEVVPDDETYHVSLRKSNSIMFSGPCLFEILRDFDRNLFHIAIFTDQKPPRLVVKWQIDHIRQYGSNQMAFKFESGSKSSTGVDWFILDTEPGAAVKIHKAVDYWAKHIVEQVRNMPVGGSGTRGRGNTLPQNRGPPTPTSTNASFSSSLPRQNGQSVYQSLTAETQAPAPVYETAGPSQSGGSGRGKKSKNQGSRGAAPAPPPPVTQDSNRALYQPLQRVNSNPGTGHETYAGLNPATMEAPPPIPGVRGGGGAPGTGGGASGGIRGDFYMQLNPQTRSPAESQQYMGLKDIRT